MSSSINDDDDLPTRGRRRHSGSNDSSRSQSTASIASSIHKIDGTSTLFISETIARDDTQGKEAKEVDMLTLLSDNFNTGVVPLLTSAHSSTSPSHPGLPPQPALEPIGAPTGPEFQIQLPQWRPQPFNPIPPPFDGVAPGPPRRPARTQSIPEPTAKVLSSASWRRELGNLVSNGENPAESSSAAVPLTQSPAHEMSFESPVSKFAEPTRDLLNLDQPSSSADGTKDIPGSKEVESGEVNLALSEPILVPSNLGLAGCLGYVAQQFNIRVIDQSDDATFHGFLLDTINLLERRVKYLQLDDDDNSTSDNGSEDGHVPPRSETLHRVYCTDENHEHGRAIYADEPVFSHDPICGEKTLSGKVAIPNLRRFTSQHPSICFIIFKEYSCVLDKVRRNRPSSQHYTPSERSERIRIVSPILKKALEKVAEFLVFEHDDEMDAPYRFLFHHRKKLAALEENSADLKGVLAPLREFLDANYAQEYQDAEAMFRRGVVTAQHFGKLFKPNQIVLERPRGTEKLQAYVLKSHPVKLEKRDKFTFRGWSWQYTGTQLQRRPWNGFMDPISDEETPIADLAVHPAKYARRHDIEMLEERGGKFWHMKNQDHVSYTGWDDGQSHYYVSTKASFLALHRCMHACTD